MFCLRFFLTSFPVVLESVRVSRLDWLYIMSQSSSLLERRFSGITGVLCGCVLMGHKEGVKYIPL